MNPPNESVRGWHWLRSQKERILLGYGRKQCSSRCCQRNTAMRFHLLVDPASTSALASRIRIPQDSLGWASGPKLSKLQAPSQERRRVLLHHWTRWLLRRIRRKGMSGMKRSSGLSQNTTYSVGRSPTAHYVMLRRKRWTRSGCCHTPYWHHMSMASVATACPEIPLSINDQ